MTDDEKVYSVDEVNHLISEMDKVIAKFKTENAALRERLGKAVEFPRIVHGTRVEYINSWGEVVFEEYRIEIVAEARLAELKGGKK